MSHMNVFRQFAERTLAIKTQGELVRLLEDITVEMGFHYFALINHVDLRLPRKNIIHFDNYPAPWAKHFITKGLHAHDPVLQASLTSNVGFAWTDVPRMISITGRHRTILDNAAKSGLGDGFTVPANIPGEYYGSCSFATKRGVAAPVANFPLAHLIGAFAYQAARRLKQGGFALRERPMSLTPRQRDCLLWAMRGKTDWEIGQILGLHQETVSKHLDMARDRYDVTKRLPLAVHAIFDGQISIMEVLFEQLPLKR
jgi:LuxR family transcriptional regulator, quorum-sensing system regulator CciR